MAVYLTSILLIVTWNVNRCFNRLPGLQFNQSQVMPLTGLVEFASVLWGYGTADDSVKSGTFVCRRPRLCQRPAIQTVHRWC